MSTVLIVILAVYASVLTYLKATAAKTQNTIDDKVLAALEKVEPFLDSAKPKQ